ncbi:hypothetical protein CGBL_0103460 [Corynebacterium glutamicum]|nr:hypothetical protein CGBL_0103460 [Corynebacterium glutamicum]
MTKIAKTSKFWHACLVSSRSNQTHVTKPGENLDFCHACLVRSMRRGKTREKPLIHAKIMRPSDAK